LARTAKNSLESLSRALRGKRRSWESGSGVTGKMDFDTLWQQALAPTLAAATQNGASVFCFHARPEAELLFASPLRWLVGAFHCLENGCEGEKDAARIGICQR